MSLPCRPQKCSAPDEHFLYLRHSLRGNNFKDKGWTALFKALCENKGDKIESWDLSGERVGPETAKALAEYISVSPALKSVKCARAVPHVQPNVSAPLDILHPSCHVWQS